MMRVRLIFAVYFLAALAGGLLYRTSYAVDEQKTQLSRINRDIIAEQENIQVLGAEWTYLTDPKRIEGLAEKYLHMATTKPQHVAALRDMPALFAQTDDTAAKGAKPAAVKIAKPAVVAAAAPVKTVAPVAKPVLTASAAQTHKPTMASTHAAARVMPTMAAAHTTTATPSPVKMLLASFQPGRPLSRD